LTSIALLTRLFDLDRARQISTTKGTGGDVIILEEAAYIDPGFFYVSACPTLQRLVVARGRP
jgi:hypothetical protein